MGPRITSEFELQSAKFVWSVKWGTWLWKRWQSQEIEQWVFFFLAISRNSALRLQSPSIWRQWVIKCMVMPCIMVEED
jgi:hypothetical protein